MKIAFPIIYSTKIKIKINPINWVGVTIFILLNNIYVVLFIKDRIILSVWPIYTLFVFKLKLSIHNI